MSEISKDEVIESIANSGAQPFSYDGSNFKFHIAHFEVDLCPEALQLADQVIRNVPNQKPEALEEQLLVRNPRGTTFIMPKLSGLLKLRTGDRKNQLTTESQRAMQQAYVNLTGELEPVDHFGVQIFDGQVITAFLNADYLSSTNEGMFGLRGQLHGIHEMKVNNYETQSHEQVLYAGLGQIAWRVANPQPETH